MRILATDIDPRVVADGRRGVYPEDALADSAGGLAQALFHAGRRRRASRAAGERRVAPSGRRSARSISTAPGRCAASSTPSSAATSSSISTRPTQQAVWSKFAAKLEAGGWLYIGHSERVTGPAAARFASDGVTTYRLSGRSGRMKPVRVLVVDDSATMRGLISRCAGATIPASRSIGQAADPLEARDAIKALNPDVMTLDVEMPKMDGLEFLDKVMRLRPFPVVMVSTLTARGASATIRAHGARRRRLRRQAVDRAPGFVRRSADPGQGGRRRADAAPRRRARHAAARSRLRLQAGRQDRRHRRLDRRRRGAASR